MGGEAGKREEEEEETSDPFVHLPERGCAVCNVR